MLTKNFRGVLMVPAGVAGGEGGGGGATLTMEAVLAEVDKRIGNKLTAGLEDFKKNGLTAVFEEKLAPITTGLTGITEALGKLTQVAPSNGGGGQGGEKPIPPEVNVKLKELGDLTKAQGTAIDTLRREKEEANKRAELSERNSSIKTALNGISFVTESAADTAFKIVDPFIKRQDDGSLIGGINGSDYPLDAFVKDYLVKEHPYLLRASGVSGSGASSGGGVRMGVKADLNDIKQGMKAEDRANVLAAIGAALQSA